MANVEDNHAGLRFGMKPPADILSDHSSFKDVVE